MSTIRVMAISDIHGYLPDLDMYEQEGPFDVLLIAGDLLPLQIQRMSTASYMWVVKDFYEWCNDLIEKGIVKEVCYIPGNHDFIFDEELLKHHAYSAPKPSEKYSADHIHLLIDEEFVYNDWKIYGSPWCPNLKNWAFYGSPEKLYMQFGIIPTDTDILVTHCPPSYKEYGKILNKSSFNAGQDCGSKELQEELMRRPNIKLHVFGHIHSGDHRPDQNENGTILANVSTKGEDYNPIYEPLIMTLRK